MRETYCAPGPFDTIPTGRTGKIERFFRTVRDQFLVEITGEPDTVGRHYITDLDELNRHFAAWVETVFTDRKCADYASGLR